MAEKNIITKEDEALLLNTVAKGATPAEFQMFLEFCRSTGLNPYKREIWFIKTSQGVQMMTGINGFLSIANAHPQYDGMQVSIQEGDDGKLISATAVVWRKDRKYPSTATVYFNEYFKPSKYGNGLWEKMPRMMLQKVAKSVALREAFPQELNGMYTVEEMPDEYALKTNAEAPKAEEPKIEEKRLYKYILTNFTDQEKQEKALNWCEAHNVNLVYNDEEEMIVAESDKELPFFKEVEIK